MTTAAVDRGRGDGGQPAPVDGSVGERKLFLRRGRLPVRARLPRIARAPVHQQRSAHRASDGSGIEPGGDGNVDRAERPHNPGLALRAAGLPSRPSDGSLHGGPVGRPEPAGLPRIWARSRWWPSAAGRGVRSSPSSPSWVRRDGRARGYRRSAASCAASSSPRRRSGPWLPQARPCRLRRSSTRSGTPMAASWPGSSRCSPGARRPRSVLRGQGRPGPDPAQPAPVPGPCPPPPSPQRVHHHRDATTCGRGCCWPVFQPARPGGWRPASRAADSRRR